MGHGDMNWELPVGDTYSLTARLSGHCSSFVLPQQFISQSSYNALMYLVVVLLFVNRHWQDLLFVLYCICSPY